MKNLSLSFLFIALTLYGCKSDDKKTTDGSPTATDGSGSTSDGSGADKAASDSAPATDTTTSPDVSKDTAPTGDTAAVDLASSTDAVKDTGSSTDVTAAADICASYVAGSGMLAGVSAAAFCDEYETVCHFGGAGYATKAACITSYGGAAAVGQTCRAGHLCNAKAPGGAATHCPHATGAAVCQ